MMRAWAGAIARRLGLAAAPLDYRRGGAAPPGAVTPAAVGSARSVAAAPRAAPRPRAAAEPVDVIVPVHGAPEDFARCLASVLARTDLSLHRLVVVLDGAGQVQAERALADAAARVGAGLVVLAHPVRRGFVHSVNRGIAASRRDVVLLNSDTVVTERWLDKLQAAARSAADVATATPLSNNATICSVPRANDVNALPAGHDVDSFARLVAGCAAPEYPRLPTGVGVCLYVRRAALDAVGALDPAFGLGYGEETDFCLRALRAGFAHVCDDATFIYHAGQRSFGASRAARVRAAERRMARRHPEYRATIARFLAEDPLREVRRRIVRALEPLAAGSRARPRLGVLHVVHGWPPYNHAGTEVYARELARRQVGDWDVAVHARISDRCRALGEATELLDEGMRVRLAVNDFTARDPLARNALRIRAIERDVARLLDEVRPSLVHVHHLAGHGLGLLPMLARRRIPVVHHLHDWWSLCARSNLLLPSGELCAGPSAARCAGCLPLTGLPPAALLNRALHRYRAAAGRRALAGAAAIVAGSAFARDSYRALGALDGAPVHLVPYGVRLPGRLRPRQAPLLPLRFGVIGSMMPHKGIHVAVEAFRGLDPARATLDLWGDARIAPEYTARLRAAAGPGVRFHGNFPDEELEAVFARLDALLAPSLGLESFGLAVREAMARGVPVIASHRGALAEAIEDGVSGAFVPAGDAGALRARVEALCARPAALAEWAARLPPITGMDEHAEAIDAVYRRVLREWRRASRER